FLDQAARLSSDLADVLEANRPFLQKNVTEGGKTLQVLFEERGKIPSLVRGLREFFQVLGEVADRIPDPSSPGTTLAAVKYVAGGGPPCGALPCTGSTSAGAPAAKGAGAAPAAPSTRPGATPLLPPLVGLTPPVHLTG